MVRDEITNDNNFSKSKLLQNYALANNSNIAPLIMFASSYYFNHKYQKINEIIQSRLINKFNKWKNL